MADEITSAPGNAPAPSSTPAPAAPSAPTAPAAPGIPLGETAASMASVAAAKEKLAEMTGGKSQPNAAWRAGLPEDLRNNPRFANVSAKDANEALPILAKMLRDERAPASRSTRPPLNPAYKAEQDAQIQADNAADLERQSKLTPEEKRLQDFESLRRLRTLELTSGIDHATGLPLTAEQREVRTRQLRQAITMLTTKDEADAWHSAPLSEQREYYGLKPIQVPGLNDAEVQESFGWAESEFITVARNEGLTAPTVRALRDTAIKLALQMDGKPLEDAVLEHELGRHRLTTQQKNAMKQLWRRLEGGQAK